jgi:hypothetical protein
MPRHVPPGTLGELLKAGFSLYEIIHARRIKVCFDGVASPIEHRYWACVRKDGPISPYCPELGRCWRWLGSKDKKGYGHLRAIDKSVQAHHFSYFLAHPGEPPLGPGEQINHLCHNPSCTNSDHLVRGTPQSNMDAMVAAGRSMTGERNNKAKLTEADVEEIRRTYRRGSSIHGSKSLGRKYGVTHNTILNVVRGITWKHAPRDP